MKRNNDLTRLPGKDFNGSILIVCEGKKTEPNYFNEIRIDRRKSKELWVIKHPDGTDPKSIVQYAVDNAKGFYRVFAVFDRDEHATYSAFQMI